MSIRSSQLYLITSCEDTARAWTALRNYFKRDTLVNKLMLKKQYFRMGMKDGTSMEAHIKYMKELTDKLAAINAPIAEEDQVVTLLGSLPPSYSTLVTAPEARDVKELTDRLAAINAPIAKEDQVVTLLGSLPPSYSTLVTALEARDVISLSYVQQSLIHEEQRIKESNTLHTSSDTMSGIGEALIGKHEYQTNKRYQYKKTCYFCGESGYFFKDCPKSLHQKPLKSKHKVKSAYMVSQGESHSDSESDEKVFGASSQSYNSHGWIVDSGASSHMTQVKEFLVNYEDFDNPQKVSMGDGCTVEAVLGSLLFKSNILLITRYRNINVIRYSYILLPL